VNTRIIRIACIGALVFTLVSCSSQNTNNTDKTERKNPTTTLSATEDADCSHDLIEDVVGEPTDYISCSGVWASVMPNSYAGSCTECESVWLYKWESGKWNLKGNCIQYNPLLSTGCYGLSGTMQNSESIGMMTDLPDQATACKIWTEDSSLRNISKTGCTPSADSIEYDRTEKCDSYYPTSNLPIGRCDKGRGVRSIQKRLIAGGAQIELDGYFGTGTVIAVMDFQTAQGLTMSGYVDEKTWKALIPNQTELPGADSNGDGLVTPDEFLQVD
jgi:hypothetical protein